MQFLRVISTAPIADGDDNNNDANSPLARFCASAASYARHQLMVPLLDARMSESNTRVAALATAAAFERLRPDGADAAYVVDGFLQSPSRGGGSDVVAARHCAVVFTLRDGGQLFFDPLGAPIHDVTFCHRTPASAFESRIGASSDTFVLAAPRYMLCVSISGMTAVSAAVAAAADGICKTQ